MNSRLRPRSEREVQSIAILLAAPRVQTLREKEVEITSHIQAAVHKRNGAGRDSSVEADKKTEESIFTCHLLCSPRAILRYKVY